MKIVREKQILLTFKDIKEIMHSVEKSHKSWSKCSSPTQIYKSMAGCKRNRYLCYVNATYVTTDDG